MYQKAMQQILSGCKEVYSSLNDIVIFSVLEKKHNKRLIVLKTLKEKKCDTQ